MDHHQARALLDQQFAEEVLAPHQAEALRLHLGTCEPCRARYDRLVELEQGLASGVAVTTGEIARLLARGAPGLDTASPITVGSTPARTAHRARRWIGGAAAAIAACAAALLLARAPPPEATSDAFTARGSAPTGALAWVRVFGKTAGAVAPIARAIQPRTGLLFSYTNLHDSGLHHLLIAGRDAQGRVHWYHPAYLAESDDPVSVAIDEGAADHELPDAAYADHPEGPLEVCAVFTREPLRVKDVDAELEHTGHWPAGALLDCHTLRVTAGGAR